MDDTHVQTFPGRYEIVRQICAFVASGAKTAGLDKTAVFHVELACDEACTNIIEHAYGGENIGNITVSWHIEKKQFVIILQDFGRSFNPKAVPTPPTINLTETSELADNLKVGGLGMHFIRKVMDTVQYTFDEEAGNQLTLIKKIP